MKNNITHKFGDHCTKYDDVKHKLGTNEPT